MKRGRTFRFEPKPAGIGKQLIFFRGLIKLLITG